MSDNGQQVPLIERLRSVPPLPLPFGYLTQTSSERNPPHGWAFRFSVGEVPIFTAQQMEQMRQEVAVERERREDIRANERLALREKLICAALTGMLANHNIYGAPDKLADYAIKQADAVLAALDKEAAK